MSKTKIMCPQAAFCTPSVHNSHNKTANMGLGLVLCCPVIIRFEKASHFPRKGLGGQATFSRVNLFQASYSKKLRGRAISPLLTDQVSQTDKSILVVHKDV